MKWTDITLKSFDLFADFLYSNTVSFHIASNSPIVSGDGMRITG
jgi:hypothetical protein